MEYIRTDTAPAPIGPYEQAVMHNGTIYLSMQLPLMKNGDDNTQANIEAQTSQLLENIKAILESRQSGLAKTLRISLYVTDLALGPQINKIYEQYFPDHKPARTVIGVAALPKGYLIAADAIACC